MPEFGVDINIDMNNAEAIQEVIDKLEELKASAGDISSSMEDVDSESISELGIAADEASSSAEELSQSLDGVDGGSLSEASSDADGLSDSLGDAAKSSDELSESLSVIEGGMLLGIGQQISQMSGGAEGMSQEMNAASISVGQLATQTGIAEPQMVSLINHISNATFPNDEAMMYVKNLSQMGVESKNFGKSATDIDKINDAFGMGATTTNSLATEMSVLGVDMNNVSSSFNALAYANANTKGGMENFYTFLRKYDSELHDLGYNMDQTAVIISGATQKFGGGRAALSGLSTALKEADGDSRKLEEALGLQAGSLDNATKITGEYEGTLEDLAAEEGEHKTLLDQLGAAWEDISLSLSGVLSPLGGVIGIFGEMSGLGMTVLGLQGITQGLGGIGKATGLLKGGPGILSALAGGYNALAISEYIALWPLLAIIGAIILIGVAIYELGKYLGWWSDFGTMIDAVKAGLERLWSAFINNPDVQAFIETLKQAWADLSSWVSSAWTEVSNFLGLSSSGEFDAVRAIIDIIGIAWAMLRNKIMFVIDVIKLVISVYQSMYDKAKWVIDQVVGAFTGFPKRVENSLKGLAGIITAPFQKAYDTVKPLIDGIVGGGHSIGLWGADYEGFAGTISVPNNVDYEGFSSSGTLNSSLTSIANNSSSSRNITFNNNFNGIIEEEASKYIVDTMADHVKKQNLIRGV